MKKLSKPILMLLACWTSLSAQTAQTKSEEANLITITPVVSEQAEGIPPAARSFLENRLRQIITRNGFSGSLTSPRFILVPDIHLLTRDVLPGPPPLNALNMDVTLYIADAVSQMVYSQENFNVKGVGSNENKAYIQGIKNIRTDSPEMEAFIDKGKKKIIEYYSTQCDALIREAQQLAARQEYEKAVHMLTAVPVQSKACYDKAVAVLGPMFQEYIDFDCQKKLDLAKAEWAGSMDQEKAVAHLKAINPRSRCRKDAEGIYSEIKDWTYKQKKVQLDAELWDKVLREQALIEAWRAVGVAYGQNQPNTVYNIEWLFGKRNR